MRKRAVAAITALLLFLESGIIQMPLVCAMEDSQGEMHEMKEEGKSGNETAEGIEEESDGEEEKRSEIVFPEFWLSAVVNDAGNTVTDTDGIYYFRESMTIRIQMEDGSGGRNESSIEDDAEDKEDPNGRFVIKRNGIELTEEDKSFEDVLEEEGEYHYDIVYITENDEIAGEHTLTVKGSKVTDTPFIQDSYELEPVKVHEKAYFKEDPRIRVCAGASAGIVLAEYRVGDGEYQVWKDFQSEDTCYMYGEHSLLEEDLGETDVFAELLASMADGSYRYTFRITDVLGGTASADVEFVIDKTAPDRQIFVSYASDGTNPQTGSHTGLMDFVRSVTDRLFGKTEIWFDLYVRDGKSAEEGQDTASGIDTEDLCDQILTSGGKAAVQKLQVIEEGVSFVYEGITYSDYTQIRGCVKLPFEHEESMSDHLQIGRMKDRAGNRMNVTDVENLTGMTVLYIDSKSPLLSVDYGDGMIDEEKKAVFYPNGTALPMVLKEENYQDQIGENGDPVKPSVMIQDHGSCGAAADEWELSCERDDQVCTRLVFPEMSGMGEVRYDFTVEYQDGAGNFLKPDRMVPGDAERGVYTGYTIVVDNRPPELTSFSVHGAVTGQCSSADVYQNAEGEDIRFSFSIDDHETYWDPEAVKLIVWNTDTQDTAVEISGGSLQWEDDGRSHQAEYAYDGEEGMTAAYQIMLSYVDCAGNRLTGKGDLKDLVEEGVYTSRRFILDHEAPGFCIAFNEAVRLVKDLDPDPLLDRRDCMPQTGYTAYYDDTVEVFFSLRESCTEPLYQDQEFTGLRDFELVVSEKDTGDFQPDICWNRTGDFYEGRFFLAEEGRYTVSVRYRDMAGNVMKAEEVHGSRWESDIPGDGNYESVLLILDRTPPVYQVSCVDMDYHEKQEKAVLEENGCRFFSEPIYLKLEVKDENLRFHELLQELQKIHVADREGNEILNNSAGMFLEDHDGAQLAEGGVIWYLPLLTEAVYEIPVSCMDLAGNRTEQIMERICVDQTDPGLELSWSVEKSGFLDAVRYRDIRYLFADGRMTIKAAARDLVSGIRSIEYRMEEEDGRTIGKTMSCMPAASGDYEITVPTDSFDFKGIITATVRDWSGNSTVQTCGYIAESEERHSQEGEIRILTETSPSRTVAGVDYYNTDIRLKLVVQDNCSGLRDINCRGGKTVDHHRSFSEKDGIVYKYQEDLVLNAVSNNENGVSVRADYQDHTGHTGTAEQSYHIDVTAPVIEVKYDNDQRSDQGLYAQPRRAVVTIRERNFDPADVEFQITNTDGILPSIGEWQATGTGDDTLHVCWVDFLADGDYTFTLGFTDLAGNRSEYGKVDEFTIDQTKPEVSVSFDHESGGDQEYYAQSRVAVIDVLEHNFDASLIQIIVKEQDDMTALNSSWRREGDHNVTRVRFDRDGDYSLSIMGTDQAGNQMKEYETERFVIDQTAPVLEISGLKDRSANKGAVTPVIRCLDANYQKGAMKIQLRGCRNGLLDLKGTCTEKEGEELFLAEDFAYIPEMDDLYWLAVSVSDLAGNVSQKEICFSVNRFGSVYTLEDKTELLAGSRGVYYTNTEQDIIVTETNVDTLEFLEISCNRNGKLLTLDQGEDYYVQESGTDESWKQYIYTIPGRNFTEEGTYILMLYSEDRAENTSDNQTKGKKLEFVIDKTAPSVLLSGVEDGKQYRENSRRFTLDVQDNVRISEVKVNINGVVSTYYASELLERDGRLTLAAGSADHWQSICITASDAAGNTKELEELKFLLTSNLWIQFLTDRNLFCCTICGLLLVWAGGWRLFFRRRQSGKCKRCG